MHCPDCQEELKPNWKRCPACDYVIRSRCGVCNKPCVHCHSGSMDIAFNSVSSASNNNSEIEQSG